MSHISSKRIKRWCGCCSSYERRDWRSFRPL